ncbi:MAG: rhodanese-like domain-containing protein [Methylocystaceae bacterium]
MFFGRKKSYKSITPREAQLKLQDQSVILVDVRMPEEHAQKHIPGSILIPLGQLAQEVKQKIPELDTPIIVYCQSGGRSARAANALTKMGYKQVYNLGGINSWPFATQ